MSMESFEVPGQAKRLKRPHFRPFRPIFRPSAADKKSKFSECLNFGLRDVCTKFGVCSYYKSQNSLNRVCAC